jgi:hypothetical protein
LNFIAYLGLKVFHSLFQAVIAGFAPLVTQVSQHFQDPSSQTSLKVYQIFVSSLVVKLELMIL